MSFMCVLTLFISKLVYLTYIFINILYQDFVRSSWDLSLENVYSIWIVLYLQDLFKSCQLLGFNTYRLFPATVTVTVVVAVGNHSDYIWEGGLPLPTQSRDIDQGIGQTTIDQEKPESSPLIAISSHLRKECWAQISSLSQTEAIWLCVT